MPDRKTVLRQVWRLALPVILTNFMQSLVNVVDVFMVGRLGPIEIAAVGIGGVIRMVVLVMVLSVSAGAMSLVAQAKGARDPARMSFVTRQAISSGLLLSVLLTILGLLVARPLLVLANSGGDPRAVELGASYLYVFFLGTPFLILNIVLNRLMQGAGDTVTPLLLTVSVNLLNILFNYIFMFGVGPVPAYGIVGASLGTVISRGIGLAAGMWVIYSGRNVIKILAGSYRPDWQTFADIFSIGVPSGIQGIFRNGSRLLIYGMVTSTEVATYGAAALTIGFQVESLAFMPVLGINVAATTLVGQALGRWQTAEARRHGDIAIVLGVVVMTILAAPIVIFAPTILRWFDPSAHPMVMQAGTAYMRINTVVLPATAVSMVANGALRGAGDSVPGMVTTMFTGLVVSLSLAWLFAFPLGYGSTGIWVALACASILNGVIMWIRWRGRAWPAVALHKSEIYRRHLRHLSDAECENYLNQVRAPLMAQSGVREQVGPDRVIYNLPDRSVAVHFAAGSYTLT